MEKSISDELREYKAKREERIMRRVKAYIEGEFSLDEFYDLERLNVLDDRAAIYYKETAAELHDLDEKERAEREAPAEVKSEPSPVAPRIEALDAMTTEEFKALPALEQCRYYDVAPDKVREILERRPAYMDIIDPRPKPRDYTGTTLEEFKNMSIRELTDLANTDRALYDRLQAEQEGERNG